MSNFVSINDGNEQIKLKNLFYVSLFIGFIWILFHFTVVFFFGLVLKSVFLVGLFLGIGNIVALLIDIPIGVMQKYILPRNSIIFAGGLLFLVSLIFMKFIYMQNFLQISSGTDGNVEKTISLLSEFLDSGLNIVLLVISACMYGIIKEILDVTVLSYIFNISTPSEYASIMSKNNIYTGAGSLLGLIFSGILLALNIKLAIIIFIVFIILFILFVIKYFDNSSFSIKIGAIKAFRLDNVKDVLINKENVISKITPDSIVDLSKKTKVILLKPIEIKKSIDFDDVISNSISTFKAFSKVILGASKNLIILWFIIIILQYGFWDTFVSTFQIEFLDKIISENNKEFIIKNTKGLITGYLLLGLIILPAFLLQEYFIGLARKIGVYKVIMLGLFLSSFSLFSFGLFSNIYIVILLGLLNSVGYAASMPLAQSSFSCMYNEDYSEKMNLNQIDSTASAAPLKILLNFANVLGLVFGSILVGLLGFNYFFIFFSIVLFFSFVYSFLSINDLLFIKADGSLKREKEKINQEKIEESNIKEDKDFV